MNKIAFSVIFLFLSLPFCEAQEKDEYDKKYEWRIRQEILYGVYIPKDVSDAIVQLNRLTDEESKLKYKSLPEDQVTGKLFFSLGRWITHNWGLFEGSRLSVSMQDMGIYHPDDMARFIMVVFHRSLNKKPLEIKALMKFYQEKYERQKEERIQNGTIIHEERRPAKKQDGGN
jgi:hypothetical protein